MYKSIKASNLRNNLSMVLKELNTKEEFMLIIKNSKPVSAIVNLDFFEDLLARASKKYLESIKTARKEYENGDVYSHEELFGEI